MHLAHCSSQRLSQLSSASLLVAQQRGSSGIPVILIGRRLGTAGLTIVIVALAFPTIWVAPKFYGYVTYLRTPTDQLPPGDARRTLSDCAKRAHVPEVVCAH